MSKKTKVELEAELAELQAKADKGEYLTNGEQAELLRLARSKRDK